MAAVPSIGRAHTVEAAPAPEADLTRALYEQYAEQILRYCLHQLGSREEAEDAVQSTFLNAFRGIKRGIVPELESAWLFKIAHNVCLSRRRSTWRRGRIESPADFDVVEAMAPAPSRRADELIGLQDVLERMPEQQRRAILLREWQGLSYREIGEELELSQAAVETLIFRARRSLAQGLDQPAEPRRKRHLAGAFGTLLSSAQSFLVGGGAAVKVAATVAVVGAGTVVATAPVHTSKAAPHLRNPAAAVAPTREAAVAHTQAAQPRRATSPVSGVASAPVTVAAPKRAVPARRHHRPAHPVAHRPSVAPAPAVPAPAAVSPPAVAAPAPSVQPARVERSGVKPEKQRTHGVRAAGAASNASRGKAAAAPGRQKKDAPVAPPAAPSETQVPADPVQPADAAVTPPPVDAHGEGRGTGNGHQK